jgi:hypothetical protein
VLIERKKFCFVFGGGPIGWKIVLFLVDGRIGCSPNLISWVAVAEYGLFFVERSFGCVILDMAEYGLLFLRRFLQEKFCCAFEGPIEDINLLGFYEKESKLLIDFEPMTYDLTT